MASSEMHYEWQVRHRTARENETPVPHQPTHSFWLKICFLGRHHAGGGGDFSWKIKWLRMPSSPSSSIMQSDTSLGLLLFLLLAKVLHVPPSTHDYKGMTNDLVSAIRSALIDESSSEQVVQSSLLHRHPSDQVVQSSLLTGLERPPSSGRFVDQVVRSSLSHQTRRQAVEYSRLLQWRRRPPSDDDVPREINDFDSMHGSMSTGQVVESSGRQEIRVVVMRIRSEGEGDSSAWWGQEEPDRSSSIDVGAIERVIYAANGDGDGDADGECPICLERLVMGVEVARTPCMHVFHSHCIDRWLQKSHSCPLCRFHMSIDFTSYSF